MRLVEQDTADEPVSGLLARIRVAHDQKGDGKRKKARAEGEPMAPTQGVLWE